MKIAPLTFAILLVFTSFSAAAGTDDDTWMKLFQLMTGSPRHTKVSQLDELKELVAHGLDVNTPVLFQRMAREGEKRTDLPPTSWPLDMAADQGHVEMVKFLLSKGAKLHGMELPKAVLAGSPEESLAMVEALLGAGADANSRCENFTALLWASYKGKKEVVKALLAQPGLQLDITSSDGHTPLMAAAEQGHAEIVDMLVQAGAKAAYTNARGETAASLALKTLAKQQAVVVRQQGILLRLQTPEPK